MRAVFADAHGELQIVLHAEDDNERLLLREFVRQVQSENNRFHLHGYGGKGGSVGYDNINFGTVSRVVVKDPEAPIPQPSKDDPGTRPAGPLVAEDYK